MAPNLYTVKFQYEQKFISIQSDSKEKMKYIINKYKSKGKLEQGYLAFLYNGNLINEELTLKEIINKSSEKTRTLEILVYLIEEGNKYPEKNKEIII